MFHVLNATMITFFSARPSHNISWSVVALQRKPRTPPSQETIHFWSMSYGLEKGTNSCNACLWHVNFSSLRCYTCSL